MYGVEFIPKFQNGMLHCMLKKTYRMSTWNVAPRPSACLTIRVYTFVRHKPYSHHFLYFSPSPDIFHRALHSQFII